MLRAKRAENGFPQGAPPSLAGSDGCGGGFSAFDAAVDAASEKGVTDRRLWRRLRRRLSQCPWLQAFPDQAWRGEAAVAAEIQARYGQMHEILADDSLGDDHAIFAPTIVQALL